MARASTVADTMPAVDVDIDKLVRERIRGLRIARGWSLDEMAERARLNASTLSRIETGSRRLAIDTLTLIARALETTIDELVTTARDDDGDVVIRPERCVEHGVTRWNLSRTRGPNGTQVVKMRIVERRQPPTLQVHPGRDWFYVVSGTVRLHLGDRQLLVHAGQAADFATMTPHAFTAHGGPAELISIFDGDGERAHLLSAGARRRVR